MVTADMNGTPLLPAPDGEVPALFRASRPLLHSILVIHYRFTEEHARDAEADLECWFERMARRSGQGPARLREALIAASCEYARSTQQWRLDGKGSGDPRFDRFLARDSREVAREIARKADSNEL